jgi:tetratricopeptide (TPR) repeat protein
MLSKALARLGTTEIMLQRYADAELNLSRALSVLPSGSARNGPEAAEAYSSLGLLYYRQGRYLESEQSYRRASVIRGSGPDAARTLAGLARVYIATARYGQADIACSQALDLLTRHLGPSHAEVGATLQILAKVRRRQKRYAEEAELLKQALDITAKAPGRNRMDEAIILVDIGVSYALRQHHAEAEASVRKAIEIEENLGGDANKNLSIALNNLAVICKEQGRYAEALDLASRALGIRKADEPGVDSALLALILHKAELLRKVHRKKEAAQLEREARQARAGLKVEQPGKWMIDYRELRGMK